MEDNEEDVPKKLFLGNRKEKRMNIRREKMPKRMKRRMGEKSGE